jgi:prepilin-type N-terminal cleavage/methylation domain-containing protein
MVLIRKICNYIAQYDKYYLSRRRINLWAPRLSSSSGFTLIEIMVATAISMLLIGSVYAAFKSSLKVYQYDETKIIMLQKCRTALDRIAQDASNMFYADGDEEMTFLVDDSADTETNLDNDMISFVTVVSPNLRKYVSSVSSNEEAQTKTVTDPTTGEEKTESTLPSDLARVVYFIGPNPEINNVQSLMRIETTDLDIQTVQDMLSQLQSSSSTSLSSTSSSSTSSSSSSSSSQDLQETLRTSVLVDNIAGLNIRYFDGTDWVDTWDMQEQNTLPKALEITLSVTDPDNKGQPLTQVIVVYLPFSDSSGQTAGTGNTSGNQQQTPGM